MKKNTTLLLFNFACLSLCSSSFVNAGSGLSDFFKESIEDKLTIKLGATHFAIETDSSEVSLSGFNPLADLALDEGPIEGSGIEVNGSTNPSLTVGYKLPWGDGSSWSLETVIAESFSIDINFIGTIRNKSIAPEIGGFPTGVPALGSTVGTLETLPVTVTLLYSFNDSNSPLVPYLGVGATYVYNSDHKINNTVLTEVSNPKFETNNDYGWILQAGLAAKVSKNWSVNADLKYATGITIDSKISDIAIDTNFSHVFGPAEIQRVDTSVDLDIFVISLNSEYQF